MSDQLFKDSDEIEATYVGEPKKQQQPNVPPRRPSPAFEQGMITTPPALIADDAAITSEPFFQGALEGDNEVSKAPRLAPDDEVEDEQ